MRRIIITIITTIAITTIIMRTIAQTGNPEDVEEFVGWVVVVVWVGVWEVVEVADVVDVVVTAVVLV